LIVVTINLDFQQSSGLSDSTELIVEDDQDLIDFREPILPMAARQIFLFIKCLEGGGEGGLKVFPPL
jgi:hypothetical protein